MAPLPGVGRELLNNLISPKRRSLLTVTDSESQEMSIKQGWRWRFPVIK